MDTSAEGTDVLRISVTGDVGSGKSTIARGIARQLGLPYFSVGSRQRQLATDAGVTTLDLNLRAETDESIDHALDAEVEKLEAEDRPAVIDGRLGFHFAPSSFKVYFLVDPDVGAGRVLESTGSRRGERYADDAEARAAVLARQDSEIRRFRALYGVDLLRFTNYDLVIDTTASAPDDVGSIVIDSLERWSRGDAYSRLWLDPKRLLPTKSLRALGPAHHEELDRSSGERSSAPGEPVVVASVERCFFLLDGHRRTSAAIRQNLGLVPARLAGEDDDPVAGRLSARDYLQRVRPAVVSEWEQAHRFAFGGSYLARCLPGPTTADSGTC